MDNRKRRRKRRNAIKETMDIVKTILLVVIAVAAVAFVFLFIKGEIGGVESSDSKMSVFGSLFSGKETEEASNEESSGPVTIENEQKDGFAKDSEGHLVYRKEGLIVKDRWLDLDRNLYRIDKDGFVLTGSFEEDAFVYETAENGVVTSIRWNESYADSSPLDTPGLVKSGSMQVYLNPEIALGRLSAIVYKKSSVSHLLGGEADPQYTRAGSLQVDAEGYIYWLPSVKKPDELEAKYNRKLYRMMPGTELRQYVAEDVDGYRVLAGANGETVIYYCKGSGMYRCGSANCKDDVPTVKFTEDMEYELDLSTEGKLYLKTAGGIPVTQAFDSFTTGGMTYKISENGEILSREDQIKAMVGVDLYSILSDEAFYTIRSVVLKDTAGKKSMISSDFIGECRCIYYNEKDGRLYAEYVFSDGTPHVVMITTDGDVDLLLDNEQDVEVMEIYGFTAAGVVVKETGMDGTVRFAVIENSATTPLAIATDPVPVEERTGTGENASSSVEMYGPGYTGGQNGNSDVVGAGPGTVGTAGTSVSGTPAVLPQPTASIPDEPVTLPRNN